MSPEAAYTTAPGPAARTPSRSPVAATPTVRPSAARSPASRPTLSGSWTTTAASSSPGWATTARIAARPTLPVPHTTVWIRSSVMAAHPARSVLQTPPMPAFLVHGVPDTHVLWDDVCGHLGRTDVLRPDLPGFAPPTPAGFEPTKEGYVEWLIGELEAVGEPVDLVGHDWGSLLVVRAATTRPDLIRTLT